MGTMAAEMSFLQSLQPLALLALREAGGEGYAICDVDQVSGQRTLKFSYGEPIPDSESNLKTGKFSVAAFPLRVDGEVTGALSFVFRGAAISPEIWALLEKIAGPVEAVWQFAHIPKAYAALAARIGELEAELADSKIADRARGLLGNVSQTQGPLDILERHVEGVLRSNQLMKVLEEMSRESIVARSRYVGSGARRIHKAGSSAAQRFERAVHGTCEDAQAIMGAG